MECLHKPVCVWNNSLSYAVDKETDLEFEFGGELWPIGSTVEWEDICRLDQLSWDGNMDKQLELSE